MKLHRLELAAFGPYADTVTVDFDALGADGLFLLYGETGAGKTTVLDGIAYALFGRVPGARQQANRLRCDHADPGVAARVSLELTLGGRRLRVTRHPEWLRPKRRGEGTTKEQARALLEQRRDGAWQGLSTRIDEVSQQLQEWLGMSAEQFFQVVLLPQGEFARFLRAESTEREELLERLFGTRRFGEAEAWLAQRRRSAQADVQGIEEQLSVLLARLCQAAGVPESATPELADAGPGWITELVGAAEQAAGITVAAATEAAAQLAVAAAESARVTALRARQQRRADAESARAALDSARPQQDARRGLLEGARRAAGVRPLARAWRSAQSQAERADSALTAARQAAPTGADPHHLRDEIALLGAVRANEAALPGLAAELAAIAGQREDAAAAIAASAARRAELPAEIEAVRSAVAAAEAAAARVADAGAELVRAEDAFQAGLALVVAAEVAEAARGEAVLAVDAHQSAREHVLDLRQRRLAGIAAELAERLGDGEPCPVCGGREHPELASPANGRRVTEAAEATAAAAEERARRARDEAARRLSEAEREVARLGALTAGRELDELESAAARARHDAADVRELAAALPAARARLSAVEDEHTRLADGDRQLAADAAALAARHDQAAVVLATAERSVAAARGDDPSVDARIARLTAEAAAVDALREAERVAADRATAAAEAWRAAEAEAVTAGYGDLAAAEAAALDDLALAELEAACREFDGRDAATAAALADPDLAGLEPGLVDPGPAQDALERAQQRHTTAASHAHRADQVRAEVTRLAASLTAAVAEAEPVRQRAARIAAVADLVAGQGQNARRMTLRAYVLSARLDEVARSASQRLRRMSGGRYSFVFTGDADSRRVRAGLGLRILDDYSGLARSTRTLSGGESFMASLSLALGLADVVAAESGGISIETLFIDEGFGSLDADTLDLVMDTLDELRAGGRVIGLVSHVAEMRQRIPMRLRVRKSGVVSRLELEAG